MEVPHSNISLDNFRHMFPKCNKCQDGNVTSEKLLVHLTATHFRNEALKSFGDGIMCLMCKKSLAPHKETYREYHVLSHMVEHFDQFAPKESKTDFEKIIVVDEGSNDLEEISEPVHALAKKQFSPDVNKKSCSEFKFKNKSRHDKMTGKTSLYGHVDSTIAHNKGSTPLVSASESLHVSSQNNIKASENHETKKKSTKIQDRTNKQDNLSVIWFSDNQNNKYQLVLNQTGKKGFLHAKATSETIKDKEVLTAVCQNRHTTFQKTIKSAFSRGHNTSNAPYWRRCENFFKQTFPKCTSCQRASYKKARYLVEHLFNGHYRDKIMEAFGSRGNNCLICHMEDVVPSKSPNRSRDIVRHFIKYHKKFLTEALESDEAREVVRDVLRDSRSSSKVPGVPKKLK